MEVSNQDQPVATPARVKPDPHDITEAQEALEELVSELGVEAVALALMNGGGEAYPKLDELCLRVFVG